MGFGGLPSIGDIASKAAGILGSGAGAPAASQMKETPAKYINKGAIDETSADKPGATALDHPNVFDPKLPIHFIHFGYFLTDSYDHYPHGGLDDTKTGVLPDGNTGSRAVMFRAALEREAILVSAFMQCAKDVVQEMKDSQSSVDTAVSAVGSLLGQGDGNSGPDPGQVDPYLKAAQTAGGKVNVAALHYPDMHQAGVDLHQAWVNFDGFAPSMSRPPDNQKGGGLFGNIPSMLPIPPIPGVGDVFNTVTGILFKMFEIYQAMYLKLRGNLEQPIRDACFARSLAAIRSSEQPVFDVWSVAPEDSAPPQLQAPDPHKDKILDFSSGIAPVDREASKVEDPVNQTYDQGLDDIESANYKVKQVQKQWQDFWNSPPDKKGPGIDQLNAITALFADPSDPIFQGFCEPLKLPQPPDFVKKVLGFVVSSTAAMLGDIYLQLQDPAFAHSMTKETFDGAGRKYFRDKLIGLLKTGGILDTIAQTITSAQKAATGAAGSVLGAVQSKLPLPAKIDNPQFADLTGDQMADKAVDMLDEKLGKDIDPILDYAMGSLYDRLVKVISKADSNALVMEQYFAQLPLLLALMVRNIFFPFWQMVAEKVFGAIGMGAALATSPVAGIMQKARDEVSDRYNQAKGIGQGIKDTATNYAKSADSAVSNARSTAAQYNVTLNDPLGDTADKAAKSVGDDVDSVVGDFGGFGGKKPGDGGGAGFPGSARLTSCSGADVTKDEWDSADAVDKKLTIGAGQ